MTVFDFVLNFKSCSGLKTVTRGTLFVNTDQMNALETKLRWLFLYMRGRYKNVFHFWQGFKKGVFKIMYTELSQMSKKICYFSQPQKQWRVFRHAADIFVEGMYPRPRALWSKHRCALDWLSYAHSYQVGSIWNLLCLEILLGIIFYVKYHRLWLTIQFN